MREHEVADDATSAAVSTPGAPIPIPTTEEWARYLAPVLRDAINGLKILPDAIRAGLATSLLPFVIKWMMVESGGDPCAVGYPADHGASTTSPVEWRSMPREIGIAQMWNPDDFQALGLSPVAMRAYCVPGDRHQRTWNGKPVVGFSGEIARPLTDAEMHEQAVGLVGMITKSVHTAMSDLIGIGAGPGWTADKADFWHVVKLQHGMPQVSHLGFPAVKKKLGRPPSGWNEFRANVAALLPQLNAGQVAMVLRNAEETASAFAAPDQATV